MQFISGGPDIPDELLQAHEDGRLVFFCGAGVSYPAGLPGFEGLVKRIYKHAGTLPNAIEQATLDKFQYDATLDLLEQRLPGNRLAVRRALEKSLKPKLRRQGALDTHHALLTLARNRDGALRLISTNFDTLFAIASKKAKEAIKTHAAPMLPIPKPSRWDGLVYLHGELPKSADDAALNRLVITSGDFGLAYLVERWAARFVSELFRNFSVCFIGYSIDDPVMRYMMHALAADRMLGEKGLPAWAFASCSPGQNAATEEEWRAKGVKPILYEVPAGTQDHSMLHKTLHAWADTYRNGVTGKQSVVVRHALARPSGSTKQDDFVGRMLWALADPSGLPAKQFADFDPVPALEWLHDAFADTRFIHNDLPRFGVPPLAQADEAMKFSLVQRPSPYNLAPAMQLMARGAERSQWDKVMQEIGRWLLRHLNDPNLLLWCSDQGGTLSKEWARLVDWQLSILLRKSETELAVILKKAPNAVPNKIMRSLWHMMIANRIKPKHEQVELYRWEKKLKEEGFTTSVRLGLLEALTPKIKLSEAWHTAGMRASDEAPLRARQIINCELVLTASHLKYTLQHIASSAAWIVALPNLLSDFQRLLLDGLEMMKELGEIDEKNDISSFHLPSIEDHPQNRDYNEWILLIKLLRDSWLAVAESDPDRAGYIAHVWFDTPFLTFKRLGLFAAAHSNSIPPSRWIEWLLAENAYWLWSPCIMRETLRLLIQRGAGLPSDQQVKLETAILSGPPKDLYRPDMSPEGWQDLAERAIWLRLSKLGSSGLQLTPRASAILLELSEKHPYWHFAEDGREEFSIWSGTFSTTNDETAIETNTVPSRRDDLAEWLEQTEAPDSPFTSDGWEERCRDNFAVSLTALCQLARQEKWPSARWRVALETWTRGEMIARSWHYAAPILQAMPTEVIIDLRPSLGAWLMSASKVSEKYPDILYDLCARIVISYLSEPFNAETELNKDPLFDAINHPLGQAVEVMLAHWLKQGLSDGDGLPEELRNIFTSICQSDLPQLIHGKVLLASRVIPLLRADKEWTQSNLLSLFSWSTSAQNAKAAWSGFLWSPRLYWPLFSALKTELIETASHYNDLDERADEFVALLTFTALDPESGFTYEEMRPAFLNLPSSGLERSAATLLQALEAAGELRAGYWTNRVYPFWHELWPKDDRKKTVNLAATLAELSIATGKEFPNALETVFAWLIPIPDPYSVVTALEATNHCTNFPVEALQIMAALIQAPNYLPNEFSQCLDKIVKARPDFSADPSFQKLRNLAQHH